MNDTRENSEIRKILVNRVDLTCQIMGQGTQDLVFVHGYSGCSTGKRMMPLYALLTEYFRVVALDMRGHGGSAAITENFTLDQLAKDIIAVCEVLDLRNPLFVGHSLGGLIGLSSELKSPGLFSGLVLLATAAATGAKGTADGIIDQAVRTHQNREAMCSVIRGMFVRDISDADLNNIVETVCLVDPVMNEQWLRKEWPKTDISERLKEIAASVLLINGARDIIVSPEAQHQTALHLQNYKEVIFSDEGHLFPLEAPQRTAREIINFCQHDLAIIDWKPKKIADRPVSRFGYL